MATPTCVITMTVRWWVRYYLHALALFCITTGLRPDTDKVTAFIVRHGIRVQFKP